LCFKAITTGTNVKNNKMIRPAAKGAEHMGYDASHQFLSNHQCVFSPSKVVLNTSLDKRQLGRFGGWTVFGSFA